jgi:transposase InsO family protein
LGFIEVPAASTITEILRREGRLGAEEAGKHTPWQRFEQRAPNDLWQMDFKGDFPIGQRRCHPLTMLDDHSRFALLVEACGDQRTETVRSHLVKAFERYGLPYRILADNGSPWGGSERYTLLGIWLIRLGIDVCHSRAVHPQTVGKEERFNRTLKTELIGTRQFTDLEDCQRQFSLWRDIYNQERPHEALGLATPASRYTISHRPYPSSLAPIEYGPQDLVRKVQQKGEVSFRGREWLVGKGFRGYPVGIRPTLNDGVYNVYFCHQKVASINLRVPQEES